MTTYWTPEFGRRNQSQLIKMIRDKQQKQPICLMCEDRGYVEVGSGPLGGLVNCECAEAKDGKV